LDLVTCVLTQQIVDVYTYAYVAKPLLGGATTTNSISETSLTRIILPSFIPDLITGRARISGTKGPSFRRSDSPVSLKSHGPN